MKKVFLLLFLALLCSSASSVFAQATQITEAEILAKKKRYDDSVRNAQNQPAIDNSVKTDEKIELPPLKYSGTNPTTPTTNNKKLWPRLLNTAPFPIPQFSVQGTAVFLSANGMHGNGFLTTVIVRTRPLISLEDYSSGPMVQVGRVKTYTQVIDKNKKDTVDYVGTTSIIAGAYSMAAYSVDADGSQIAVLDLGAKRLIDEGEYKKILTKQVSYSLTANGYLEQQSSEVFGSLLALNAGISYQVDATISGADDTTSLDLKPYDASCVYLNGRFTTLSLPLSFNPSPKDKRPLAFALDVGMGITYGFEKKASTFDAEVALRIHKKGLTILHLEAKMYSSPKETGAWKNYNEFDLSFYPLNIYYAFRK